MEKVKESMIQMRKRKKDFFQFLEEYFLTLRDFAEMRDDVMLIALVDAGIEVTELEYSNVFFFNK